MVSRNVGSDCNRLVMVICKFWSCHEPAGALLSFFSESSTSCYLSSCKMDISGSTQARQGLEQCYQIHSKFLRGME